MIPTPEHDADGGTASSTEKSPATTSTKETKKMITITKFINGKKTIILMDPDELEQQQSKPTETPKKKKKKRTSASTLELPDNFMDLMKSPNKRSGGAGASGGKRYSGIKSPGLRLHNGKKSAFDANTSLADFDASMTFNGDESFNITSPPPSTKKKEYGKSMSALDFDLEDSIPKLAGVNKKKHKSRDKHHGSSKLSSSQRSVSPSSRKKITPKMSTGSLASLSIGSLDSGDDSFFFHEEDAVTYEPIQDIQIQTDIPDIEQKVKSRKKSKKSSKKNSETKKSSTKKRSKSPSKRDHSPSRKKKDANDDSQSRDHSPSRKKKNDDGDSPSRDHSPSRKKDSSPSRKKDQSSSKKSTKKSTKTKGSTSTEKSADIIKAQQKRMKEIEKKLAKIEKEKKADLKKMKQAFEAEKEELQHSSMAEVEREETKYQEVNESGEDMIEFLQQESQTLVDQAMVIHQEITLAKKQNKLLEKNKNKLESQFEGLSSWVANKEKANEKKERAEKQCIERYIPTQKAQLYESSLHCRVEYNIKNSYKKMLHQVVDAVHEQCTNIELTSEVLDMLMECQREVEELPIVLAPEGLEHWLSNRAEDRFDDDSDDSD